MILVLLVLGIPWNLSGNISELEWRSIDQVVINISAEDCTLRRYRLIYSYNELVLSGYFRWTGSEVKCSGNGRDVWKWIEVQ